MQIVGILLVHNEDRFLRQAVENVLGFCDRIIIADHHSTDGTPAVAEALAREHAKVEVHRIQQPQESQAMLAQYAGTDTWVLGVDGDELYDAEGLQTVRAELLNGQWREWWVVFGNVLNCTELDLTEGRASGYLAPPCRSMTKLYNFAALEELDLTARQRLMGRHNRFKPGYSAEQRLDLYKTIGLDEARFRCLHTCFLPRSSTQAAGVARENITDLAVWSLRSWWRRGMARLRGRQAASSYKEEKYRRGPVVTVDATPFLRQRCQTI